MVNLRKFLSDGSKQALSDFSNRKWKKALLPGMDSESALEEIREEDRAYNTSKKVLKKKVKK